MSTFGLCGGLSIQDRMIIFVPCHNSTFGLDGSVTDANSPSPRGLDTMDTKVEDGFVWIRFQQFRPNIVEKIPLS